MPAGANSESVSNGDWLSVAVKTAHVAVVVVRLADSQFVDINPAFTRLLGFQRDAVIGRTAAQLDLWVDEHRRSQLLQWLERGGSVTGFEATMRHASGKLIRTSLSARVLRFRGDRHYIAFLTDTTEQARLEAALEGTEERLRSIFAATHTAAFHQDLDLRYTWVANPALGASEHDVVGRTDEEILGDAASPLSAIKRRVLQTAKAAHEEVFVRRGDHSGWFDLVVQPERDAAGTITGILCAATDISARKATGAAADVSRIKFDTLLAAIQDCAFIADSAGRLLDFNQAFVTFHRFPDRAAVPRFFTEYAAVLEVRAADGHEVPVAAWPVPRALRGESATDVEYTLRRNDTGESWIAAISFAPLADAQGKLLGAVVTARDVTERKQAEARLRLWAESFANATFGLAIADVASDTFVAVNPAFARERGYTTDELVGKPVRSIYSDRALAALDVALTPLESAAHRVFETEHRCKDGRTFPVEVDLTIMRAADGRPLNRLAYVTDLTQRKTQEQRIAALNANLALRAIEAEAATRAKNAFLTNISHEIRTPLNAILGMTALLRQERFAGRQADRLNKLEVASAHLHKIVDDLLDVSEIQSGALVIDAAPLRVEEIVADAAAMIYPSAVAKALTVGTSVDPAPVGLIGDARRIRQALLNYAGNAVKFSASGSVQLRARLLEDRATDALVRFEVADTGPGIAPDVLQRLFVPFEQADNTLRRRHGGAGLGLSIARHLAILMGGDAGAESTPGLGSTFWFTVRFEKTRAAGEPPVSGERLERRLRRRFHGARVLVIEREPVSRFILCELLHFAGLATQEATDPADAVSMVMARHYDLILLDLPMPVASTLDTARQIRQTPNGRAVALLACTTNASAEAQAVCRAAGVDDFLIKPLEPEKLYAKLLTWLARDQPAQPPSAG